MKREITMLNCIFENQIDESESWWRLEEIEWVKREWNRCLGFGHPEAYILVMTGPIATLVLSFINFRYLSYGRKRNFIGTRLEPILKMTNEVELIMLIRSTFQYMC